LTFSPPSYLFSTKFLECQLRNADNADLKFIPSRSKVNRRLTRLSIFYLKKIVQTLITNALRAQSVASFSLEDSRHMYDSTGKQFVVFSSNRHKLLENLPIIRNCSGFSAFVWIITFCSCGKILIFLVCIVACPKWSCA
jgi:hypothetical protein